MLSRTKDQKTHWTYNSPVTPEFIDEYVSGWHFGEDDEFLCAARDAMALSGKRQLEALKSFCQDIDGYIMGDQMAELISLGEGFLLGARFALEKVREINPRLFQEKVKVG